MAKKICKVCGKEGYSFYPYCLEHLQQFKKIEDEKKNTNCIICGHQTKNNYLYCDECFQNIEYRKEELDKNQKPTKFKDYYYNAKDYAMRVYDEGKIYYQKITMVSLNELLKKIHNDTTIEERIKRDLESIDENLEKKIENLNSKIKETEKIQTIKETNDNNKPKTIRTQDGHFVGSELEMIVDDVLYNNLIPHAYNVKVDEIIERTVNCDWYIPITFGKGIYIELWGMVNDKKYNQNKAEKLPLYKKYNLPLIEISYSEAKYDTQRLKSLIINEYNKLKKKIMGN